jgi:hypothetical protein
MDQSSIADAGIAPAVAVSVAYAKGDPNRQARQFSMAVAAPAFATGRRY